MPPYQKGVVSPALKEVVVHPLLKRPSMNPTIFDNFHPVSTLSFLGKVGERVTGIHYKEPWMGSDQGTALK